MWTSLEVGIFLKSVGFCQIVVNDCLNMSNACWSTISSNILLRSFFSLFYYSIFFPFTFFSKLSLLAMEKSCTSSINREGKKLYG